MSVNFKNNNRKKIVNIVSKRSSEYKRSDKILQINNVLHNSLRNALLFTSTSFLLFKRSLHYKENNDAQNEKIFIILSLLTIVSSCFIILILIFDNLKYYVKLGNDDKGLTRIYFLFQR